MIIIYESKTGFTKKYAEMLGEKTKFPVHSLQEFIKEPKIGDIIFLGWVCAGKIKGLSKLRNHVGYKKTAMVNKMIPVKVSCRIRVVCAVGTGRGPQPSEEAFLRSNGIESWPFFYLRGGCIPLSEQKGLDKWMMNMFVGMLKKQKEPTQETLEGISNIENGVDYVNEDNLKPVLDWLKESDSENFYE